MKIETSINVTLDKNDPICHAVRLIGINRVAKRAGISGTYVSLAINGKTTMPVQTVSKLIAALKGESDAQ